MPLAPTEEFLAWVWQGRLGGGRWLEPLGGPPLRVVYPGARRRGKGPDFQGALLLGQDGLLHHGDVEVHLRAADWRAHGHQRDRAYDRTLLHVVWGRAAPLARRSDGTAIPQLDLSTCLPRPLAELLAWFQRERRELPEPPAWTRAEARARLEAAGLARFQGRSTVIQGDVVALGAAQAAYRHLAAGLGYVANQRPFRLLTELVPLGELRAWVRELGADGAAQRLLAWAGLAGSPPPGGLPRSAWVLAGVRPNNLPQRRLRALCLLVARLGDDPAGVLAEAVLAAARAGRPRDLARLLLVPDSSPRGLVPPSLVGPGRTAEMVVSALLPWAHAWAEVADRPVLRWAAVECYRRYPRGADNALGREAARLLGLERDVAATACQQQGLLHLYHLRLHDPASWRQDPDGSWRWRPWVEAVEPDGAEAERAARAG